MIKSTLKQKEVNETTDIMNRLPIYKDWILFLIAITVTALDQLTKFLVREYMYIGQSIPENGFFRLTYYTNSGTIFGLFPGIPIILTVASVIAIVCLIYFYGSRKNISFLLRVAIALLLGGAIGNFIDRVSMGRVTDFIDVGLWPVFNVADSAITCGIFLLIVVTAIFPELGKPNLNKDDTAPSNNN